LEVSLCLTRFIKIGADCNKSFGKHEYTVLRPRDFSSMEAGVRGSSKALETAASIWQPELLEETSDNIKTLEDVVIQLPLLGQYQASSSTGDMSFNTLRESFAHLVLDF
jgi:hypothetical protein